MIIILFQSSLMKVTKYDDYISAFILNFANILNKFLVFFSNFELEIGLQLGGVVPYRLISTILSRRLPNALKVLVARGQRTSFQHRR